MNREALQEPHRARRLQVLQVGLSAYTIAPHVGYINLWPPTDRSASLQHGQATDDEHQWFSIHCVAEKVVPSRVGSGSSEFIDNPTLEQLPILEASLAEVLRHAASRNGSNASTEHSQASGGDLQQCPLYRSVELHEVLNKESKTQRTNGTVLLGGSKGLGLDQLYLYLYSFEKVS